MQTSLNKDTYSMTGDGDIHMIHITYLLLYFYAAWQFAKSSSAVSHLRGVSLAWDWYFALSLRSCTSSPSPQKPSNIHVYYHPLLPCPRNINFFFLFILTGAWLLVIWKMPLMILIPINWRLCIWKVDLPPKHQYSGTNFTRCRRARTD